MYSLAERDRRWDLLRNLMDLTGVDALIVYGEPSAPTSPDTYLSGGPPGATVLLPRHGQPRTTQPCAWITDARPARHTYGLVDALKELGLIHARVGVLGLEPSPAVHNDPPLPYSLWAGLLELLPHTVFVPVRSQFVRSTMPQSAEEITVLTECGRIGAAMAASLRAAYRQGAQKTGLYAAAMHAGHLNGAEPEVHLTVRDDVVLAGLTCRYGGRETYRALTLGSPGSDVGADMSAAVACHRAGLDALRPGVLFGQVADTMRTALEHSGAWTSTPLIRGLNPRGVCGGVEPDPRTPAHTHRPTVGYDLPVTPGMTFALHVTCDRGRGSVTYGKTVVIGPDGPCGLTLLQPAE